MTMQKKLLEAARSAANEAVRRERGRILWLCDEVIRQAEEGLQRKILIESQRHAAEVKLQLAKNIVATIRRAIVSDLRPASDLPNDPILEKLKEIDDADRET